MMGDKIDTKKSLAEFFDDRLKLARTECHVSVSDETHVYVLNILLKFANSEHFFTTDEKGKTDLRPLALRLYDAVFSEDVLKRANHLRSLGDSALFQAGYLQPSPLISSAKKSYTIRMGESAYQNLSQLTTVSPPLASVFEELAHKFTRLTDVIHLATHQKSDLNILQGLDEFYRTRSPELRKRLIELGLRETGLDEKHLTQ